MRGELDPAEKADWKLFGFTLENENERPSREALDKEWKSRRNKEHPDRFSGQGDEIFNRQNEIYKNLSSAYERLQKTYEEPEESH